MGVGDAGPPDPLATLGPVGEVLGGIRALSRGIDSYRHAVAGRLHLGLAEIITLTQLYYDEPVRAGEVAARTGLTLGSVTSLLDRLERRGYITRVRPPENRRVVLVELTEAGRELGRDIFRPVVPLIEDAANEPDAPDPVRMAHCLHRIAELFEELASGSPDGPARPGG